MADERREKMLRFVQFQALGTLVEWLLTAHFAKSGNPEQTADDMLLLAEKLSDQTTFPEAGAEWSDLAAQEYRDTLVRHIHRAKALATGTPFDPDAYRKRAPDSD